MKENYQLLLFLGQSLNRFVCLRFEDIAGSFGIDIAVVIP